MCSSDLLLKFAQLYGVDLSALIGKGSEVNPAVSNITNFVLLIVVPLNLLKGTLVSSITTVLYKKFSHILKQGSMERMIKTAK